MRNYIKPLLFIAFVYTVLVGCAGSRPLALPLVTVEQVPQKVTELSEKQLESWNSLDLIKDTIPGMSVNKAYDEIIKNKIGKTTIVAVIDSGIDIDHEDLENVIWTNPNEIPNNGKDDDNNGYIDDIHGWNFLGDAYEEQLEYVRLLVKAMLVTPNIQEQKRNMKKSCLNTPN